MCVCERERVRERKNFKCSLLQTYMIQFTSYKLTTANKIVMVK